MSGFELVVPILAALKGVYDLGQHIADNVRARREARAKAAAKPCPPPTPPKALQGAKQAPRQDGKR